MIRLFVASLLISGTIVVAEEPGSFKLAAPAGWGGETINLPPGFAPDMKLQGSEHIRFAPGMMKPESESFFSYAFVFELQATPVLTGAVVKDEILKYYRGLCQAVLNGKLPNVNPSGFTLELQQVKSDAKPSSGEKAVEAPTQYLGTLDWIEPFATKKPQKLNLEIRTWSSNDRNYIFVCITSASGRSDLETAAHDTRRLHAPLMAVARSPADGDRFVGIYAEGVEQVSPGQATR